MALLVYIAALLLWGSGCLPTPPEELEPAIGDDDGGNNSRHRPGEPCLLCHGQDVPLPNPEFSVAGTVYDEIDAPLDEGLRGVEVIIVDADGRRWTAVTNRAGNFYFSRKLPYPLTVKIKRGDDVSTMQTRIWRNGSCAHCHGPEPDEASVGRVFVDEEMTP